MFNLTCSAQNSALVGPGERESDGGCGIEGDICGRAQAIGPGGGGGAVHWD